MFLLISFALSCGRGRSAVRDRKLGSIRSGVRESDGMRANLLRTPMRRRRTKGSRVKLWGQYSTRGLVFAIGFVCVSFVYFFVTRTVSPWLVDFFLEGILVKCSTNG